MLKRSGRGHDPDGVAATKAGECVVVCPACPQPGRNLPQGWEDAPLGIRYVYLTRANFHLVRRNVSSEKVDPGLSPGWSYYTETTAYMTHIEEFGHLPQEVD
jgi:hypothetical protein